MPNILSSRPWLQEEGGLPPEDLTIDELKLISSFLWCTRLGSGISPFRDAAYTLGSKIDALMGEDFQEEAVNDVDMQVVVQDHQGNVIDRHHHSNIEFEV